MRRGAFAFTLLVAACAEGPGEDGVVTHRDAIVYGDDDRRDVYEHPDATLRDVARSSVVALVPGPSIERSGGGPRFVSSSLAEVYDLCPGERFESQPVVAACSGVLIDEDLVLTSSHCLNDTSECGDFVFAFDYYYSAEGELAAPSEDSLYGCRGVVARKKSAPGEVPRLDLAVVRLDRKVTADRKPLSIAEAIPSAGDSLTTIGFPLGLPAKIDSNARVVDPRPDRGDYFTLSSDVFEGSSGCPVLDARGLVLGTLLGGGADLIRTDEECTATNTVPSDQSPLIWEQAVYSFHAVRAVCEAGAGSARLCDGVNPRAATDGAGCALAPGPAGPFAAWLAAGLAVLAGARRRRSG